MDNTQIGIRTTGENKEFFNSINGATQHEKFEILKRAYQEYVAKEEDFNINSYLTDAESTFNNFKAILSGLEGAFLEYKKKIHKEYVLNIEDRLLEIEEELKDITIIKDEKEALERQIEGQNFEITKLNKENDLLKIKNKELQGELLNLTKTINMQSKKIKDISTLENNLFKIETDNNFKEVRIKELLKDNKELKDNNIKLVEEIKDIQKSNHINFNLKCQELNDLRIENTKLISKIENLEKKIKPIQNKNNNKNNYNKNKSNNK